MLPMPLDEPVVQKDGAKIWYKNGIVHREDGPAVERANGTQEWFFDGVRPCENGPAVIFPDGGRKWFQHGKELTESEFKDIRRGGIEEMGQQFHDGTRRPVQVRKHPLKLGKKK